MESIPLLDLVRFPVDCLVTNLFRHISSSRSLEKELSLRRC